MTEENVRSLSPAIIQRQFFSKIYGAQKGWVYIATKVPEEDGEWTKYFFRYPDQLDEMIEFILSHTADYEVYYSPALFRNNCSDRRIRREDFQGTNVIWAEFDGTLPDDTVMAQIPEPTIRIRSSTKGHEHWYWLLSFCETNVDALEKLMRQLTYFLGADLSGWDFTQVLRPPGTIHHDSQKITTIISINEERVPLEAFLNIPEVPNEVWDIDIEGDIPDPLVPLLKYKIPENDISLIRRKVQPRGKRSSALTRVGYVCAEAGMSNAEIFAVLLMCDNKWKKFQPRGEELQRKYLIGIIRYVRKKFPLRLPDDDENEIPYFTFGEFNRMDHHVEWIVPGLIQKNGIPVITGTAGVGKTHMTFQIACHMVLGKPFLKWKFERPMTLCIASLELAPAETYEELKKIINTFSEEEQSIIERNLHVIPIGSRLPLDKINVQDKILKRLEQFKPEGIFFDSLGHAISGSPNSDEVINDTFDFVKRRINQYYDAFSWFIHHMRKGQVGNKKPKDADDIFGSAYIHANATTIVNLWKDKPSDEVIEFNYLKVRFAKFPDNFKIKRRDPVGFDIVANQPHTTYSIKSIGADFGDIDI